MIEEVRQQRPEVFSTITVTKMGYVVSKRKEFIEVCDIISYPTIVFSEFEF